LRAEMSRVLLTQPAEPLLPEPRSGREIVSTQT
jgi:hypothetical protein